MPSTSVATFFSDITGNKSRAQVPQVQGEPEQRTDPGNETDRQTGQDRLKTILMPTNFSCSQKSKEARKP